jgi:hypothetical protein
MRVELARDWFGPDAAFYEKKDNPHQFPQDWKDKLPSETKVIADEEAPAVKPKAKSDD